jgi:hypothetical protein
MRTKSAYSMPDDSRSRLELYLRSSIHFLKTWHECCPVKSIDKKMRNLTSMEIKNGH